MHFAKNTHYTTRQPQKKRIRIKRKTMNEIVIYHAEQLNQQIEVRIEDETIWLTQAQIVTLFDSSKANISEHIKHIFQTGELTPEATVRKFRTVRKEGNRTVTRNLVHYNLDMIISIGYRVNSIRGTQFRIWANKILKDYLLKGYALNNRMNRIEDNLQKLTEKVEGIDLQIKANLPPNQGIFYNGQVFDAYLLIAEIIKSAKSSIILIDNYVDETVLAMLDKRCKNCEATVFTKNITKKLKLDVEKHNRQYPEIELKKLTTAHDRFLIIDRKTVYHFGASLKDAGKKWFAFSKLNMNAKDIIEKL